MTDDRSRALAGAVIQNVFGDLHMSDAEPKWLQLSGARLAQWEREGRLADLTSSVTAGLRNYFEKRAGDDKNWLRSRDGAECVRVNDPICLDEIGAYVVAELSGIKLDDLIGEDFEAEF